MIRTRSHDLLGISSKMASALAGIANDSSPRMPISAAAKAYRRWFGRGSLCVALAVWAVALLHPPHGMDVSICLSKAATHLPCPGCGLMRSVSCTARGMMTEAWQYNAFGPVWLAVFTVIASVRLLPAAGRRYVRRAVIRRAALARAIYIVLIATFLTHGTLRAIAAMAP